jgi:hypothetical protein
MTETVTRSGEREARSRKRATSRMMPLPSALSHDYIIERERHRYDCYYT